MKTVKPILIRTGYFQCQTFTKIITLEDHYSGEYGIFSAHCIYRFVFGSFLLIEIGKFIFVTSGQSGHSTSTCGVAGSDIQAGLANYVWTKASDSVTIKPLGFLRTLSEELSAS